MVAEVMILLNAFKRFSFAQGECYYSEHQENMWFCFSFLNFFSLSFFPSSFFLSLSLLLSRVCGGRDKQHAKGYII